MPIRILYVNICTNVSRHYQRIPPSLIPFLSPPSPLLLMHIIITYATCTAEKYCDEKYEYRHVILPKEIARGLGPKKGKLLSEGEWRGIGVQQSRGWVHYAIHKPEPHIMLFRRELGTDPTTGKVDPTLAAAAKEKFLREYGS